jgi:hypothetical protein
MTTTKNPFDRNENRSRMAAMTQVNDLLGRSKAFLAMEEEAIVARKLLVRAQKATSAATASIIAAEAARAAAVLAAEADLAEEEAAEAAKAEEAKSAKSAKK